MNKNKDLTHQQKGFTLLELMVVIAIIGILSAIVLAFLGSSKSRGSDAKIQSQLKSMVSQAQVFVGANASVSATLTAITFPVGTAGGDTF